MITAPTVLILGAGASPPYGYPLGSQLVSRIANLNGSGGGLNLLLPLSPEREAFHQRLIASDTNSIDDFLESNSAFAELGKLGIAAALTVYGPLSTHKVDSSKDWYRYFWARLREGAATSKVFRSNQLRIITYNYECSLERYLARVLRASYPDLASRRPEDIRLFVQETVPVVHLHGTLGRYEDQIAESDDRQTFNDLRLFKDVARGIKIVHDGEQSAEYATGHGWLREAKYVYFLGFGYHPTNVRRLDLVSQATSPGTSWLQTCGTAYGLEEAERNRAAGFLQLGPNVLFPLDSLALLRSKVVFP
jgi:hypothetical protein